MASRTGCFAGRASRADSTNPAVDRTRRPDLTSSSCCTKRKSLPAYRNFRLDIVELALAIAPLADFDIVHAVDVPADEVLLAAGLAEHTVAAYRTQALIDAQNRMRALLGRLSITADGRLHPAVVQGRPAQVLIERINRLPRHAVVVVGRRGRATDPPTLLGTAAKHVLEEASRDVLVGVY